MERIDNHYHDGITPISISTKSLNIDIEHYQKVLMARHELGMLNFPTDICVPLHERKGVNIDDVKLGDVLIYKDKFPLMVCEHFGNLVVYFNRHPIPLYLIKQNKGIGTWIVRSSLRMLYTAKQVENAKTFRLWEKRTLYKYLIITEK